MALYFNNGFGKLGSYNSDKDKVPRNSLMVEDYSETIDDQTYKRCKLYFKLEDGTSVDYNDQLDGRFQPKGNYQIAGSYLTTTEAANTYVPLNKSLDIYPDGTNRISYIDFHDRAASDNDVDYQARISYSGVTAKTLSIDGGSNLEKITLNKPVEIKGNTTIDGLLTTRLARVVTANNHPLIAYEQENSNPGTASLILLGARIGTSTDNYRQYGIEIYSPLHTIYPCKRSASSTANKAERINTTTNVTSINLGATDYRFGNIYCDDIKCNKLNGEVQTSDKRLKMNIINLSSEIIDNFYDKLNPQEYELIEESGKKHFGFIAQDIEENLNNHFKNDNYGVLQKPNEDEEYYKLNYNEFIALNTDQIQKLKKRAATQDEYIKHLEARIVALEMKEMR